MFLEKWFHSKPAELTAVERQNNFTKILVEHPIELRDQVIWLHKVAEHIERIEGEFLIGYFEKNPDVLHRLHETIRLIDKDLDMIEFFTDFGFTESQNFFTALLEQLVFRFLPRHQNFNRLSTIVEFFTKKMHADGVEIYPPERIIVQFSKMLLLDKSGVTTQILEEHLQGSLEQSKKVLLNRLVTLTSHLEFRERISAQNRYVLLNIETNNIDEVIQKTGLLINEVYATLHDTGISIELVFLIERIKKVLNRLSLVQDLLENPHQPKRIAYAFLVILNLNELKNSTGHFLANNLSLISKKIVERASITGEHYIARNGEERAELFLSAAGGGLLTTFTALLKSKIAALHLPLFIEGCFAWVNYSSSFFVMQLMGLTLATKTPALTASALAQKLTKLDEPGGEKAFVDEAHGAILSGVLAAAGNVIFVITGAIIIDYLVLYYSGSHLFTNEASLRYLEDHHPLHSLTIWYAMFTGFVLWFANAVGGWFENWFVYRKLPVAIAESENLKRLIGPKNARRLCTWVSHSIMATATTIALGLFLAFATVWGKFFGVPIDVRHVTLSSGTIALSFLGLDDARAHTSTMLFTGSAIFIIGFFNLFVSFMISLIVAAQARDVKITQYPHLVKLVVLRVFGRYVPKSSTD